LVAGVGHNGSVGKLLGNARVAVDGAIVAAARLRIVDEFVDLPTRVLTMAAAPEPDLAQLLLAILGDCDIAGKPAGRRGKGAGKGIDGTVLRLVDIDGGLAVVTRSLLPFTPAEFARAKAVLDLQHRLIESRSALPDQVPASDA
jgi:hypothetical protein